MADQGRKLREWEVRWARAFLHALHGNESNGYLLRAVIAWMRAEGGGRLNPLNLKGAGGAKLKWRSIYDSAQAAARRLTNPRVKDEGFAMIVRTARRGALTERQMIAQAQDLIFHVAMSSWGGPAHYGLSQMVNPPGHWVPDEPGGRVWVDPPPFWTTPSKDQSKNLILQQWYALTGMRIPNSWFVDGVTTPPPPKQIKPPFRQDRSGFGTAPETERIDGYAAQRFYEGRKHAGDYVLVD